MQTDYSHFMWNTLWISTRESRLTRMLIGSNGFAYFPGTE